MMKNMMLWIKFFIIPMLILINIFSMFINNELILWTMMEINNMNFITLLILKKKNFSMKKILQSIFIYSIFQTLSSFMIMIHFIDYFHKFSESFMIFEMGMLMKLGIFPFHSWTILIMKNMSWLIILILSTFMKITPMMMIYISELSLYTNFIMIFSIILCSIWMMKQTKLKKIMAYSSIIHSSWMMLIIFLNKFNWMFYFSIYLITITCIFSILWIHKINENKYLFSFNFMPLKFKFLFLILLMSLMGMPPMSMMWTFLYTIKSLFKIFNYSTIIILILLMMSKLMMMISYFYISFMFLFTKSFKMNYTFSYSNYWNKYKNYLFLIISLITLLIFFSLYIWSSIY
uniref:NADH-ubiquinone oxidoreductase chain 2 n=1 Tax=Cerceris sp. SJW-2017 TaxID=2008741 RepID=A0A343DRJ2_9HYME|nr:NADH dehydrogenase subunit 2 [Cerceris sp. SJW-2017]